MSLSNDLKFIWRRVMQRTGVTIEESDSLFNELNNAVTTAELPDALDTLEVVTESILPSLSQANTFNSAQLGSASTGLIDPVAVSEAHGLSHTPTVILLTVDANPDAIGWSFDTIAADDTDVTLNVSLSAASADFKFRIIAY